MAFTLPPLPYSNDALEPHISAETLSFHYGKHHQGYLNKLNAAAEKNPAIAGKSLKELIKTESGGTFNLAAQIFNHTFYWNSMSPSGGGEPTGAIKTAIDRDFGSFDAFKTAFNAAAGTHFGSGWAWLVKNSAGKLEVVATHDAGCPLTSNQTPLLTCDVWEHAYYIDYRNGRGDYIASWWKLVNWDQANKSL